MLLTVLIYSLRSYMSSSADSNEADLRANVDTKLLALVVLSLLLRQLCLLISQASTSELDMFKTKQVWGHLFQFRFSSFQLLWKYSMTFSNLRDSYLVRSSTSIYPRPVSIG